MLSKLTSSVAKAQIAASKVQLLKDKSRLFFSSSSSSNNQKSDQSQNKEEEEQFTSTNGRQTEAEEEYQETSSEKATSVFRTVLRIGWWTFVGLFSYNYYLASTSKKPQDETGYVGPVFTLSKKAQEKVQGAYDFFTKPPVKKLLMDHPNIPGIVPPKTLVVNLTGTLVHTDFIFGKGTQVKKRPGLNTFIRRLSHLYEIVIFSEDDMFFVQEIRQNLDPNQTTFMGGFGKESMVYDGTYFKDLSYLNRDLKNVIVVDFNPDCLRQYASNAIFLDKFVGDKDDKQLIESIPFLEKLADHSVRDVREEIKKYGNRNTGKKFIEEVRAKQEAIKERQKKGLGGFLIGGGRQPGVNNYLKKDDF